MLVPASEKEAHTKRPLASVLRVALLRVADRHEQVFERHLLVVLEQVALRREAAIDKVVALNCVQVGCCAGSDYSLLAAHPRRTVQQVRARVV